MKIRCPNFVPKSGCFLPMQISVSVCPKQLPFSFFSRPFYGFAFLLKFLFFQVRSPSRSPPLSIISGFFTGKKWKTPLLVKEIKNWWNFNGIKENSIPLYGISMG